MNEKMSRRHIDNNFYRVSAAEAKKLCDGVLPRFGYCKVAPIPDWFEREKTIKWGKFHETLTCSLCEVHRTTVDGKTIWAITPIYKKVQ